MLDEAPVRTNGAVWQRDGARARLSAGEVPAPKAMPRPGGVRDRTNLLSPVNIGTIAVVAAWLAIACYAVAYLVSH